MYPNLSVYYYDFSILDMAKPWIAEGNHIYDIIDPVDGFHPSQVGMTYQAQWIWHDVVLPNSDLDSRPNKYNDDIHKLFGI